VNSNAIQILFLKDLFLSRKPLFGYLLGGIASSCIAFLPGETAGFIGFIMVVTVAIAAGIHLIGTLLLAETIDSTRIFIMSLPVSLLDFSIAKIAVVLTTFLIPWATMLGCMTIFSLVMPGAKPGIVAVFPVLFLFMLATFTVQLVTAVVTESVGWTICVLVLCNVLFNLFAKTVFEHPVISVISKAETVTWPPIVWNYMIVEIAVIVVAIAIALVFQSRKRDLV
jgi:ABC-2 type transport system permease protein